MKTKIIAAILVLNISIAYCQEFGDCLHFEKKDLLPVSPTASALGKYVDNPVSFYTGKSDITIPLYEIKLKEVSVPIALTYNPQNIQPKTNASNVGLGWSLRAGGVITRAVKDAPDDWHKDGRSNIADDYENISGFLSSDCPFVWGYLYAITETVDADWFPAIPTYHYDLDAIYDNYEDDPESIVYDFLWGLCSDWPHCLSGSGAKTAQGINRKFGQSFEFVVDKEPDIFYFNFNGYSGKFVFDVENGTPKIKTVPYQDLKFNYQTDENTGRLIGFTVIDPQGVQYKFQDYEVSIYYNNHRILPETRPDIRSLLLSMMPRGEYHSSWWLSQILTPQGETVNFEYETETLKIGFNVFNPSYKAVTDVNTDPNEPLTKLIDEICLEDPYDDDCDFFHCGIVNSKMINISAKRLVGIRNDNVDISFNANHTREDLFEGNNAKAITDIEVTSNFPTNHRIKKIKLEYDYFLTDQENQYDFIEFEVRDGPVISDFEPAKKRLRLKSVQEYGITDNDVLPATVFEYNYYDYNGNNTLKLPNRLTFDIDLWGYANGASNTVPIPELNVYPDHYNRGDLRMFSVYEKEQYYGRHLTKRGGNRLPNANFMDIGVLTKITYPTGGSTTYEYEPHKFVIDGEEEIGGGLRIAQIIKDNGQGDKIYYKYLYTNPDDNNRSSGKIVSLPMFATLSVSQGLANAAYNNTDGDLLNKYANYFSYPLNVLGQTHGSNVGYTRVMEYMTKTESSQSFDNGRTEYTYSFPADFGKMNDVLDDRCSIETNGTCDGLYNTTRVHNFFVGNCYEEGYNGTREEAELSYFPESSLSHLLPPNPNYDWNRGHLLKRKIFDASGNPVKEENYKYEIYYPLGRTAPTKVYGLKFAPFLPDANWSSVYCYVLGFRAAKYEVLTDVAKVLASKTVTDYGADGSSISEIYEYEYNSYGQIAIVTAYQSDGSTLTTYYKYPQDYTLPSWPVANDPVYYAGIIPLISKNIYNKPTEKIIKKNGKVIDAEIYTYLSVVGLSFNPMPKEIWKLEFSQPLSDFQESYIDESCYFIKDSRYKLHKEFIFDDNSNLVQSQKTNDIPTSFIWGYNNTYPVAKVLNASSNEIYYNGFEEDIGSNHITIKHTGKYSLKINYEETGFGKVIENLTQDKSYILMAWIKTEDGFNASAGNWANLIIKVIDKSTDQQLDWLTTHIYQTNGEWKLYERTVDLANYAQDVKLQIEVWNSNDSKYLLVDDIRFRPTDAQITTYTYDPLIGMTSETDANNITTYYEYDDFGRLERIRDNNGNILEENFYHYYSTNTIYSSSSQGGTISPSGYINVEEGSSKTYNFVPDMGYRIKDVLINGESQGAVSSYTFTNITTSHTILVEFEVYNFIDTNVPGLGFTLAGGTKSFTITSNVSWTISSNESWLTISPLSGSNSAAISVVCEVWTPPPHEERFGEITITGSGVTKVIIVHQTDSTE